MQPQAQPETIKRELHHAPWPYPAAVEGAAADRAMVRLLELEEGLMNETSPQVADSQATEERQA